MVNNFPIRLSILLTREMHSELVSVAKQSDDTVSNIIRPMLVAGIKKASPKESKQ